MVADRGQIRHNLVDPLWRKAQAIMSLMPRLPARFAPRGCLDDRFGRPQRIGRRRRRAIGGVALKLSEEFSNLGFKHGDPGQGEFKRGPLSIEPGDLSQGRLKGTIEP